MIKLVFSAFLISSLTLNIHAMEQGSLLSFDTLPIDIKRLILSYVEPKDVAAFALTKSQHAQLVAIWLENPQAIGNVITKVASKIRTPHNEDAHFESLLLDTALKCGKEAATKWLSTYRQNSELIQDVLDLYLPQSIGKGNQKAITFLVKSGADINSKNKLKQTPLLAIILCKDKSVPEAAAIAKFLLEHNANPNVVDKNGQTPLDSAITTDQDEIALMLIQAGADFNVINTNGELPMVLAVRKGSKTILDALISKKADVNVANATGCTPLMEAVACCNNHDFVDPFRLNLLKFLLQCGANVNTRTRCGNTALKIALFYNNQEVIKLLKKYDTEVSEE
jgi:ankyrin repeat protein